MGWKIWDKSGLYILDALLDKKKRYQYKLIAFFFVSLGIKKNPEQVGINFVFSFVTNY